MCSVPLWQAIRNFAPWVRGSKSTASYRLPADLSCYDFLRGLTVRRIRHVVLPWSPWILNQSDDTGIEILVHDDDALAIHRILDRSDDPQRIRCTVYTVHFLPSFGWNQTSLFPPYLARDILQHGVEEGGVRIPCSMDRFRCLAFHVLYHLGYDFNPTLRSGVSHEALVRELESGSADLGLDLALEMDVLDAYLNAVDWRPSLDRLEYWGEQIPFCRKLAERLRSQIDAPEGFAAFLVREAASDETMITGVERILEQHGFDILLRRNLNPVERDRVARYTRGGDWGPGPFPCSGGAPAVVIAALDPAPIVPGSGQVASFLSVDNRRVVNAKLEIRNGWNRKLQRSRRANIVHASDNTHQAVRYLELAGEQRLHDILAARRDQI